jgi:hypothetical protein
MTMKMDFEMQRMNITKAQFNAEIRCKLKGTILETWRDSITLETATLANQPNWTRGTEPYHSHHTADEERPFTEAIHLEDGYEQYYLKNLDGTGYNFIYQFDWWDEKRGSGYCYIAEF